MTTVGKQLAVAMLICGFYSGFSMAADGSAIDASDGAAVAAEFFPEDNCPEREYNPNIQCQSAVSISVKRDVPLTFASGSAQLTPESKAWLDKFGSSLRGRAMPSRALRIVGHTDALGSDSLNLQLSKRRAYEVQNYLVANYAFDPQVFEAVGVGKDQLKNPEAPYSVENRRVEFVREPKK